jgi:PAS domain S-box-containing protein
MKNKQSGSKSNKDSFLNPDFSAIDSINFDFAEKSIIPLLNFFPQAVYIKDAGLRYILANKSTLKRFGLSDVNDIIGKTDEAFFSKSYYEILKNSELDIIKNSKPIIETEQAELWFDNSVTYSLITKIPLKNKNSETTGIFCILTDITKQKEAENALGDNLKFLEALVNTLPIAVFYQDQNQVFQGCNDDFCRLLNKSRTEIIGKKNTDLFNEELCEELNKQNNILLKSDEIQSFEALLQVNGGNKIETIFHQANFKNYDNKIVGLIGCVINIQARKMAERKLEEYAEELKKINSSKDKFFSIIAHDLKNPFITLLGLTEALLEDYYEMKDEEILEYISQLRKTSKSAYQLLENLLQWSRSQTGRLKIEPSKFDIYTIIEEILSLTSTALLSKKITVLNSVQPGLHVFADREMIKTVIRNLITNAIKFTHEDGHISISNEITDNQIKVIIEDNGIGIEQSMLGSLFSIDRNFSSPGTKNEEGTGLGLILCKEFIEKNNGNIWVESIFGKGSKFIFTLPYF